MKLIMDGDGNIYRSVAEAEAQTGIPHQNISSVISGKRHTAGGTTWTRVTEKDVGENATFEDMVNQAAQDIAAKNKGGTPRQQAAAAKARAARASYAATVDKARSVGLLFYHTPKSMGKHPSNKKLHEWNMEKNPDYKAYYDKITGGSGDIKDVDFDRLDW